MTDTDTESGHVAARRVEPIVAIVIDASESADRTETTAGVAIRAARRAVGSHRVLVVGQAATEAWAQRDGARWLESDGTPLGGLEVAVLAADGAPLLYCSGNDAVIATGLDALVTSLGTDAVTASGTGWDVDGEPVPTPALFDWVPRPGTLIATGVVAADTERRGLVAALRDASRGGWKNLRTDAVTVARIGDTSAGARMRTDAWTAAAIVRSLGSSLVRRPWDGARNLAATAADAARALRGLAVLAATVVASVAIVVSGTRGAWSPWAVPAVGMVIVALGVLALLERSRPGGHVTELVRSIDVSVAAIATVARRAGRQRSLPMRSGGLALLARPVTTAATVALEAAITFAAVRFATSDRAHPASTWGTAAALLAGVVLLAPMLVSLGVVVRVRPRRAGSRAELEFSAAVDGRPAEVVDVSIGGLAVLATSSRHVGDRVAVLLNPGDGALPMTVVRCSPNGDEYTVGLQLDPDAPPTARVALERTWLDATQRAAVTVAAGRPAGDTSPSTVRTPGGRATWTLGGSVAVRVTTAVTLMALGAAVLPPYPASFASGQAVVLKAIQTGTVSLPDGSTSVTATITQVDTGKAFLMYGYRGSGNDPADIVVSGALTNSTTLTFARYDNSGPVVIEWSVVEFLSGVSVQRGVASVTTADVNVPITAVDTTRTFPMVGPRTSGAAFGGDDFFQAAITSSTNLRISTISGGTNTVPWQVVTYDEASVQTGTLSFTTTDATRTATIAPVDTAKSWLTYSLTSSDLTGDQIGQALVRGRVTDPTTLTFDRSVTGTTITLRWYLVEFLDATVVQHGNAAFGSATSTVDVALTTPVEVGRSISTGGYLTFGGRSPYTSAEDPGVGWFTTDLTSPTSLRIQRAAAVAAADLGWFVVTWPTSPTVVVNSSGDAEDTTPGDDVCWTGGNNSAGAPACTLRAAIQEANASATVDTIEFAIPTTDAGYSAGRGVFTITTSSSLPNITASVTIDGASQTVNRGDTNPVTLGYAGAVGTGPDGVADTGDEPTIDGVPAPEVELVLGGNQGFVVAADDVAISALAVYGGNRDLAIISGAGTVIEDMVIGSKADAFADPGVGIRSSGSAGIAIHGGSGAVVRNNLIGYQAQRGIEVSGTLSDLTISGNEIRGTSQESVDEGGGIEIINYWASPGNAITGLSVTGNMVTARLADFAIEVATVAGDSGIVIRDNTIDDIAPILVYGAQNGDGGEIVNNVITGSSGHGVQVGDVAGWTISQNSISNSTWIGIALYSANDGITPPDITAATTGTGTVDVGYSITAPAGTYQVEFFDNTVVGAGGFGEGETYLGTDPITHPGGTATYSHTVTGAEGDIVTATLTEDLGGGDLGSTSEFSNAFTLPPGAPNPVVLERIQKGTTTITAGSSITSVTIDPVDLTSSVLMFSVRGDDASPENIVVAGYMADSSTFELRRSATTGVVTVDWSVLTFESGVTVQHGHTGMSSVTQQDVSIGSVDLTRTFPLVSWFAGGAGFDGGDFVGAQLTSATNLRLSAVNATSRDVYYQIVSYNDAEVQRGTVALGSAASSATAAVGPVDTTKSWLTYTMTSATGTAADIGQKLIRGRVTNATTLTFDRSSTGQAVDVQWHLVEFTDDTLVQSGSSAFGTGTTQNDVAITAVDPARSVATGGYLGYGGSSSYTANDNPGVGWFTTRLTSATNMRATRGVTGSATADLGWFVITWNGAGSDTVTVNSTDDDTDLFPGDGYCDTGGVNASGHVECTVRAAIQEANASSVVDTIHFAIPGAGPPWTISPSSALPTITAGVTIDATTQPGYGSTPVISIDGAGAPGGPGLDVSGDDVTVRGLNVRSFPGDGVSVTGARFMLEASHIGTNADGTAASPNALSGLLIAGPDATIQGNLVSGNSSNGVRVQSGGDRARIVDNHIGTTVTGNAALPNGQEGVEIDEADDVVVGEPGLGNVLSGNNYSGINGWAGDATGTVIQGNLIGVGADGSTALGNSTAVTEGGITIRGPVHDWTIGGTGPGEGNVIADNIGDGISLIDVNGVADDITILGNSIHADTGLGIDIGDDGVTANDAGDADTGVNDRLNSPVISSAIVTSGTADVAYALDLPAGDYRVEFFTNPSGADPTGYGEGETFVHAEAISHAGLGSAGFTTSFAGSAGDVITATVTEDLGGGSFGSTSEFSAAVCTDSDGDGLWDCEEDANTDLDNDPATNPGPDTDGDSLPNYLDADDDGDGIPTADENGDPNGNGDPRDARDTDRDGQPDYLDIEAGPSSTPVADEQKISATSGGLVGPLDDSDNLGQNVTGIGDLDGDGINDLAVGVPEDDDGGPSRGAVYVLFMNADGTVRAEQKISDTAGGFTGVLTDFGEFGHGVATLGDIDGDGVTDIAVGT